MAAARRWSLALSPAIAVVMLVAGCATRGPMHDGADATPPRTVHATEGTTAAPPSAQRPLRPLEPDRDFPQLFAAVQMAQLFPDQKTFADAVPRGDPAPIESGYLSQRGTPGFDLRAFVDRHFALPADAATTEVPRHDDLRAHIDALWPLLTRSTPAPAAHDTLLPLPRRYVVPGGRFREIYYWDSYFTMRGLVRSGQHVLARDMLDNFAALVDDWGHVPNGNRSYYLGRSQPPFLSHMVALLAGDDPATWHRYLAPLRREHAYWMDGADALAPGTAHRRAVRLADGSLLNRYWDDRDSPRPEAWRHDIETAKAAPGRAPAQVYRDLRAGAESGWDYSSRWLDDGRSLHAIRTTTILPVDLNSLLHHLESSIARGCRLTGDAACARDFDARATARAAAIERHFWHRDGYYADVDIDGGRPRAAVTAAALFPLHAGIASRDRARSTARHVRATLLAPGGLLTTPVDTGQQWDAPNVWAPLQWIAVDGLRRNGDEALARDIASRFLRNVQAVFARDRKLVEKYDGDGALAGGGGGEYALQDGFGWTNGVVLELFAAWPELEKDIRADAAPAR